MDSLPWNERRARLLAAACRTSRDAPEWDALATMFASTARAYLAHHPLPCGCDYDAVSADAFARVWHVLAFGSLRPTTQLYSVAIRCLQSAARDANRRNRKWARLTLIGQPGADDDDERDPQFARTDRTARAILHAREVLG